MASQGISGVVGRAFHAVGDAVGRVRDWLFDDHPMTFGDVLDLVNPLQHLPVVATVYRRLTGDVIAPAMALAGGALFGGPIGAGLAAFGLAVKSGMAKQPAPEPVNAAVASLHSPAVRAAMRAHGPPAAVAGARPRPPGGDVVAAAYTRPGLPVHLARVDERA